ncbi:Transcription factor COE1 [Lunasporangiospora selenospora]|uniref:Transcription factor COE1 n=1 Tax=Lunasporangiospora selenospora TaxID=979761 RepID=A0A9P6KBX3_9FUNG|nr:Transcription factor COE1 [Lunasporangiospora selenospora]
MPSRPLENGGRGLEIAGATPLSTDQHFKDALSVSTNSIQSLAESLSELELPQVRAAILESNDRCNLVNPEGMHRAKDVYDILPPETLDHILTCLDRGALFNCVTLSKQWSRRVIPHLWRSPWMSYYNAWVKLVRTLAITSEKTHHVILQQHPSEPTLSERDDSQSPCLPSTVTGAKTSPYSQFVLLLDFSSLYYIVSDAFLSQLLSFTPNLSEIVVNSPKQFSDDSLLLLGKCCPQLRKLELPGCTRITDKGFFFILDHCSHLVSIGLSNGTRISDRSIQKMAHMFSGQLQSFNVSNAALVTGLDPGLTTLAIWCRNLVSVNMANCQLVRDPLLGHFSDSLLELNIAHCLEVTDKGMVALAEACPRLRVLDMTACSLVTDQGVYTIGQSCQGLRRLVLDDRYGRVTEEVLVQFPSWGKEVLQRRRELGWKSGSSRV